MKYFYTFILLILLATTFAFGADIAKLSQKLNLYAGSKATIQWERVFSSQRHLKRYKLNTLPSSLRKELREYLILHAADSQQPIVPGL